MRLTTKTAATAAATATVLLAAAPAFAQDVVITLRNESSHHLYCAVARSGRGLQERFVIRRGEERSWTTTRAYRLACNPPVRRTRYRLEPGGAYRLVDVDDGRAVALGWVR